MIHYSLALDSVLQHTRNYGKEYIPLKEAVGRVLAEDILADRDIPPFSRATKDGVTLNSSAVENGRRAFEITGIILAGTAPSVLDDKESCMEITTGAVLPYDADTVVMYKDLEVENGIASLKKIPVKGQNIHYRGIDAIKGDIILKTNTRITPSILGLLASVGVSDVPVKKLPRVAVISTGNELVNVDRQPELYQIRQSNPYSLHGALWRHRIQPLIFHLQDDKDIIRQKLTYVVDELDVVLLSGGASRGKNDFIPEVLQEIGVGKVFHKVGQRPGKYFWFGHHQDNGSLVFSFPRNPVANYANYHLYFKPWLIKSMGLPHIIKTVSIGQAITNPGPDTLFLQVKLDWEDARVKATLIKSNGSGDLVSLAKADGFIQLEPREQGYTEEDVVPFYPIQDLDI